MCVDTGIIAGRRGSCDRQSWEQATPVKLLIAPVGFFVITTGINKVLAPILVN